MIYKIIKKISLFVFLLAGSLALQAADDLTIQAYVDNTVVGLGQQFTLNVQLSGKNAGSADPELPDVSSFAVYLGSGSSQNIQFINGKMSVSKTLSYHFQANAVGKYEIGSVKVNQKDKVYQSNPIPIEIQQTAAAQSPSRPNNQVVQGTGTAESDLFLRVNISKKKVYQNEPVILTYKLYTRVNVSSFGYNKIPATAGFWTEEFPLPQQPQTYNEVLEGKRYTVAVLKKMAVFPMSAGTKTIDPMAIDCEVRAAQRSRDMFDDFFNDPFFGRTVKQTIQCKPVQIEVLPLPEEGKPASFSGIVGQFTVTGTVDKTAAKTNEAISYKFSIEGTGNLRTLPEPSIQFSSDFEVYPPKITDHVDRQGDVISGSKTYEYVLVPRTPGLQKIKPVELTYFDPSAKKYKTAKTRELTINVSKGDETFSVAHTGLSKEEVKLIGRDIRFIKTGTPRFQKPGKRFNQNILFWLILVLPLLFTGGAVGVRGHLDRLEGDVAYARRRMASPAARKNLSKARSLLRQESQKEFYAEVDRALTGYLGNRLNIAEAGMISEEVKTLLRKRSVRDETIHTFFDCLKTCDMKRFAPLESDETEMKTVLKQAEQAITSIDRELS